MTRRELDVLLAGSSGLVITLSNGAKVKLSRGELLRPGDFRGAFWIQAGVRIPLHSKRRHDEIVAALFVLTAARHLSLVA